MVRVAGRGVLVRALGLGGLLVVVLAVMLLLALVGLLGAGAPEVSAGSPGALVCETSAEGRAGIPAGLMPLYERAAAEHGLGGRGVFVLAAINKIETDFGRNVAVSSAGALGWMQFMPATWAAYGVDGNGDGRRDPTDPEDAIPAAARYLAASGAPGDWGAAIFAYNHAGWYVAQVQDLANAYQGACRADLVAPAELPALAPGRLAWPVSGPVTSPFGMRWGRLHAGIDIAAPSGIPVRAPAPGVVSFAGWAGGYGQLVCVTHSATVTTCSAHLSQIGVPVGRTIALGEVLGAVGCTGRCFGDHVHFEVRRGGDRSAPPVDPVGYLVR